jgi:ABC-type amino acid transport substrate-binding protein
MTTGKRVALAGALAACSLAPVWALANAATAQTSEGSSSDSNGVHPALDGYSCAPFSEVTRAYTSREINSPAEVGAQVELLQALEAVAIVQLDFQQVQGLEIQLASLLDQPIVRHQPRI